MLYSVLDIETAAGDTSLIPKADDIQISGNIKDPEKIAAAQEKQRQEYIKKAALDPFTGRIVAIGFLDRVIIRKREKTLLKKYWEVFNEWVEKYAFSNHIYDREHLPILVTFNGHRFDLPFIMFRTLIHGLEVKHLTYFRQSPYVFTPHFDLYQFLTKNKTIMRWEQTLDFFCRVFGISVKDDSDGSEIPELFKKGDVKTIRKHCKADIRKTDKLFNKVKGVVI